MFGIQTYFLSKAFGYLIRIIIFSYQPSFLDHEILLIFLMGLNLIDWLSITIAIILQSYLFSIGMNFNKKLIKFSAIAVYFGLILFFFTVLLNDVNFTLEAFSKSLNFNNFLDKNNIGPIITITGTVFAYFSIVILTFGDFSSFSFKK